MTMRVTIKNAESEESGREARVSVVNVTIEGVVMTGSGDPPVVLKPGEEQSFWIHQYRELVIQEVVK